MFNLKKGYKVTIVILTNINCLNLNVANSEKLFYVLLYIFRVDNPMFRLLVLKLVHYF